MGDPLTDAVRDAYANGVIVGPVAVAGSTVAFGGARGGIHRVDAATGAALLKPPATRISRMLPAAAYRRRDDSLASSRRAASLPLATAPSTSGAVR